MITANTITAMVWNASCLTLTRFFRIILPFYCTLYGIYRLLYHHGSGVFQQKFNDVFMDNSLPAEIKPIHRKNIFWEIIFN